MIDPTEVGQIVGIMIVQESVPRICIHLDVMKNATEINVEPPLEHGSPQRLHSLATNWPATGNRRP